MVLVQELLRYYGTVRLPAPYIAVLIFWIHGTDRYAIHSGRLQDLPVPV
jgi:hypothetical protein